MAKPSFRHLLIVFPALILLVVLLYFVPPVHERLAWRVDEWVQRVRYLINPPQKVVFTPKEKKIPPPMLHVTRQPTLAVLPVIPETTALSQSPTPTMGPTAIPTPTPMPLPAKVLLTRVRYEDQTGGYNLCAPANLSMALSFWGWKWNRLKISPFVKPDPKDKNVMPYELVDYVHERTEYSATLRLAGDKLLVQRLLATGYPVLIESGEYARDILKNVSWMGHYLVINGYDEEEGVFIVQDSLKGANRHVPYEDMLRDWRAFNYTYIVIYPADRQTEVLSLLGPDADETYNNQHAAQQASDEIFAASGIDQFFAWFNRGSSLIALQDYIGAANAYDKAYEVYPSIPDEKKPWRMVWYQTGPYKAYFFSGRYYDVIALADTTLAAMQSDKNLEETYYWRARAKVALKDTAGAAADLQLAIQYHPGFAPAIEQLQQLGVAP